MKPLVLALALAALPAARAQGALLPEEQNTINVFKSASDSVVFVTNIAIVQDVFMDEYARPQGAGSGFVWDKEGHIVTNFHVVNGGNAFLVTLKDHTELEAEVVGVEPRKDIAVLKVVKHLDKLKPIVLGRSETLQVGQQTLAIGNPFGLDNSLSKGIVSAIGRQVQGIGGVTIHDMIQTDAAINPGNSGGPLLDSSGQLVGMNTMIYSQSGSNAGVGFAVPVAAIRKIVPQLIKYGKTIQPGMGVTILTEPQKYQLLGQVDGVVVRSVSPNSPADRAGLQGIVRDRRTGRLLIGDVIVGIGDKPIKDYDDLYNTLDNYKVGDKIVVRTLREGKKRTYPVQLVNVF